MKKELAKHNWDFVLYELNGKKIFSVVFYNSFIDHSKSFFLLKEEEDYDFEELKVLAEKIRNNYEVFRYREITPSL